STRPWTDRTDARMPAPAVIAVVADDEGLRDRLVADLSRRFEPDYRILGAASPAGAGELAALAEAGERVAAVVAPREPPAAGRSGVALLPQARQQPPGAKRILLVPRGRWRGHPVRQAMVLGHVDSSLFTPWFPEEQWLYLPMTEYLADWSRSQRPQRVAVTVVGEELDQRSHVLRDMLSRASSPFSFATPDSDDGRATLRAIGLDSSRLPVVAAFYGAVLVQPTDAELVEELGFRIAA